MTFSRQEYWSGLPFPSRGYLPNPGIEPRSLALQADTLPSEPPGKPLRVLFFFLFLAKPRGMWDLSFPTRDQTQAPYCGVLTTGPLDVSQ